MVKWAAGLLCAAVLSIASVFIYTKLQSLSFHTRDYAYYAQFAAKLFDQQLSPRYSLNPNGTNLWGYKGIEGERHLLQATHFELVRFIDAILYFIFGNVMALFVLRMFLFLLPVVYLSRIVQVRTKADAAFVIALMAAYSLYPSAIFTIADDLRPYGFLAPVIFGLFLSIEYARPRREIVLWFCALLLLREEVLVFGPLLLIYAAVKLRARLRHYYITLVALFAAWSAWFIVMIRYFLWTGYKVDHDAPLQALKMRWLSYLYPSLPKWFVILGVLFVGLVAGVSWLSIRRRPVIGIGRQPGKAVSIWQIEIAILSLLLVPLLYVLVAQHRAALYPKAIVSNALYSPRWFLMICVLLMLVVVAWRSISVGRLRKAFFVLFTSFAAMAISMNLFFGVSIRAEYGRYRNKLPYVDVITTTKGRVAKDRYRAQVLTDYATHQAFFDYENVYVLERLPAYVVPGPARFYPDNIDVLSQILRDRVEFVFISNESVDTLFDLIQDAGLEATATLVDQNAMFSVYQFGS